jgi:hypothetical protein
MITEVCDHPNGTVKFVELVNGGDSPLWLAGFAITRYSNGASTGDEAALAAMYLFPGDQFVASFTTEGDYNALYTAPPEMFRTYNAVISGNGDDAYALTWDGQIVDMYGEVGVDGFGTDWEYSDGSAKRLLGVERANQTWQGSEWVFVPGDKCRPGSRG